MKDKDSRTVENDDEGNYCPLSCVMYFYTFFKMHAVFKRSLRSPLNFLHQIFMRGITMKSSLV